MKSITILATAAVMLWVPITGQAEPYSLRDFELGMSLTELRHVIHPDQNKWPKAFPLCTGDQIKGELEPSQEAKKLGAIICKYYFNYISSVSSSLNQVFEAGLIVANVPTFVTFHFYPTTNDQRNELQLFLIQIRVNNAKYSEMYSAYLRKFGQPTVIGRPMVQNNFGAQFENEISLWDNEESQITINKYGENLKVLTIEYIHKAIFEKFGRDIKALKGNAADTL